MSGPKRIQVRLGDKILTILDDRTSLKRFEAHSTKRKNILDKLYNLIKHDILSGKQIEYVNKTVETADSSFEKGQYITADAKLQEAYEFVSQFNVKEILEQRERLKKLEQQTVKEYKELKQKISQLKKVKEYKIHADKMLDIIDKGFQDYKKMQNFELLKKSLNEAINYTKYQKINIEEILNTINEKEEYFIRVMNVLNFKEIKNEGVEQRVAAFSKEINEAIYNNQPIDVQRINAFVDYVENAYRNYLKHQVENEYISDAIKSSLEKTQESPDGSIYGLIKGVPIKVNFEDKDNIIFNIDESKGDCFDVLEEIKRKLAEKDISLESIYVIKTGQTLNLNNKQSNNNNELHA